MKVMKKIGFLLTAIVLLLASCDVVEEPYLVGAESEKEILSFSVDTVFGVIDQDQKTVTLKFPEGTELSQLTPTIEVSTYATVSPASGVTQDFTQPVTYKVTAYDESTVSYQVTATVFDPDNEKSILSFRVENPESVGEINENAKTVTMFFPQGTDIANLVPVIEVSEGASVSPASGEPQDFTSPVEYTVTAKNGTTVVYLVRALVPWNPDGKTVLLHDYTGVRCNNCPGAAEIAHQLQATYGESLIVMSVHAGYQAQPAEGWPDFTTPEGTEWYNNNNSNPLGSVNRVKLLQGYTIPSSAWADAVAAALGETQTVGLRVSNAYNEASRQLTATIDAMEFQSNGGDLKVTVCLIEENIVGKQLTLNGLVEDYVHRHVFRTTLNSAYGESLVFPEEHYNLYTKSFTYALPEAYDADNCYVVAYVYDNTDDMKILQTAIQKVK